MTTSKSKSTNKPSKTGAKAMKDETASGTDDPFNPTNLRMSGSYASPAVKEVVMKIPARKSPSKQSFFRVHPDPGMSPELPIFIKEGSSDDIYLVTPAVASHISEFVRICRAYTCVYPDGTLFMWVKPIPDPENPNSWTVSAHQIADIAKEKWVRLKSNQNAGSYEYGEAIKQESQGEPKWPDMDISEILRKAFEGKLVDSETHPIILQLHGEA